jgi:translocation and assembly module TamA
MTTDRSLVSRVNVVSSSGSAVRPRFNMRRVSGACAIPIRSCLLAIAVLLFASIAPDAVHAQDAQEGQPDAAQGLEYEPKIEGLEGSLRDTAEESLNLFRLKDRLPSSLPALRARLDADLEIMEKILKSEGYYGYRIDHRIDATQQPVLVEITVDPGPAYKLTRYDIHSLDAAPDSKLPSDPDKIGITLGDPARAATIVDAQAQLIRQLGEQGHPYAAVENRTVLVHHADRTVTVALDVRAGQPAVFGPLSVKGNERVESDYILRLANLHPGDSFNLNTIDDARRRLFGTGLFDTVTINWPQTYPGQPRLPATIEVKERDIRTVGLGAFYSTTEGAGVEGSWTHRNLFGRGERLELGTRVAERELSAYADFLKPNVGRLDQNITGRADLKQEETDAYDQSSFATTIGVQRKLSDHWKGSLATSLEASRIREADNPPAQKYLIIGFPGQLAYDGSNDLFDPSEGVHMTFDVSPNQVFGDSTARFLLGSVNGSIYHEVWPNKRVILAARGHVASLFGADVEDIPASRRLYAGGGGSVRGYAYQSVGPLDENNKPTGGRSLVEMSFEARIRITDTIGIVPFVDGGSASEDAMPASDSFQWAAGLGLRYYTPIGPLRFDVAFPLNKRPGVDDSYAIYVSLGQAF